MQVILNSLKNFQKMHLGQQMLLVMSALFFTTLFIENFIFSNSFSILQVREIDDVAFQHSIRGIHESISTFKIDRLIKLNDYGYGWIFWIIVGLITYPFYLFALLTSNYLPLITVPRDLSLIFMVGTAFFVYKSLSVYSKNEFLKFIAMMLFLSFPVFGFFSLRFGTVAQLMFFSAITFYLTIRKEEYEKRDLKQIALAAAACVGTKFNGALILPLIVLIMANKLHFKINKENAKKAGYFSLNLIFFSILFSNPSLFLSPFRPDYLVSYVDTLKNNSHLSLQNDCWKTLREVVEIGYLNFYTAIAAIVFLILNSFGKNKNKMDFLFIGLWLVLSTSLLAKVMSDGTLSIINYIAVVMYLIVFSILFLEKWKWFGKLCAALLLALSLYTNYPNIYSGFYSNLKYFHLHKNPEVIAILKENQAIKEIIPDPKTFPDQKINVLMDFRSIFPYAHLERENLNVQFVFDNFQIASKQIEGDFDYISLNKNSPFFYSEQKFAEFIGGMKDGQLIIDQVESRKMIQSLIKSGKFKTAKYQILADGKNVIFFGKK